MSSMHCAPHLSYLQPYPVSVRSPASSRGLELWEGRQIACKSGGVVLYEVSCKQEIL